jgi:hypothetical protein
MVVSVDRCKYQLSEYSIGMILQATLGDAGADFRPTHLFGRVFKFCFKKCGLSHFQQSKVFLL